MGKKRKAIVFEYSVARNCYCVDIFFICGNCYRFIFPVYLKVNVGGAYFKSAVSIEGSIMSKLTVNFAYQDLAVTKALGFLKYDVGGF